MRSKVGGNVGRDQRLDVTFVGGKFVLAAGAEIAIVKDLAAAGTGLHQRSRYGFQMNVAADGGELDVAVADIGHSDWAAHGANVDMPVIDAADIDHGVGAFHGHVALQALCRKRA